MYSQEERDKLQSIIDRIDAIFGLCSGGVQKALEDWKCKQPAIMMHIQTCQEILIKLNRRNDLADIIDKKKFEAMVGSRNRIVHDYDGLNFVIVENIIRKTLPELKANIQKILDDDSQKQM